MTKKARPQLPYWYWLVVMIAIIIAIAVEGFNGNLTYRQAFWLEVVFVAILLIGVLNTINHYKNQNNGKES